MNFSFHPDAEQEFDEAVVYYEGCERGLGVEFAEEVYATISMITQYPRGGSKASQSTRRCLTSRFPFGVVYQVKADAVRIIALANLSRRPGYWQERTRENESQ